MDQGGLVESPDEASIIISQKLFRFGPSVVLTGHHLAKKNKTAYNVWVRDEEQSIRIADERIADGLPEHDILLKEVDRYEYFVEERGIKKTAALQALKERFRSELSN